MKTPWGPPALPSWLTFSPIYGFLFIIFTAFSFADVYFNSDTSFALKETNSLAQWTTSASVQIHAFLLLFHRFYLLINAKRLAALLSELHYYPLPRPSKSWTNIFLLESILSATVYLSYIVSFIISWIQNRDVLINQAESSWLGSLIHPQLYIAIFMISQMAAQGVITNTIYILLLSFSYWIYRIVETFTNDTVELISTEIRAVNERHAQLSEYQKQQFGNETRFKLKCATYQIVERFDKVQKVCGMAHEFMSPLFFTTIFLGTVTSIVLSSKAVVLKRSGWSLAQDMIRMVGYLCFVGLLETGEQVGRKVKEMKLKVFQSFIKISWEPELKQEVREVVTNIQNWNWKLSAMGFFSVERSLARGVSLVERTKSP